MICELHIENYLLINKLDIDLSSQLNIITGETGAGKSILLGAVSLLLGSKGDSSALKDKTKKCIIEAVFDVQKLGGDLKEIFEQEDIEFSENMSIRRIISTNGKSKYFVNEEPTTASTVKRIGEKVVDIHSQHQTLLLGDSDFQLSIVDAVSENSDLLEKYSELYANYKDAIEQQKKLIEEAERSKRDEQYLRFLYTELSDAKLSVDEYYEMQQQFSLLDNSQMISEKIFSLVSNFTENEDSILSKLATHKSDMYKIANLVPNGESYAERLESLFIEAKDIASECQSVLDKINNDPQLLEKLTQKLDLITTLQVKHSVGSIEELIVVFDDIKQKLSVIDNFDEALSLANIRVEESYKEAYALAEKISSKRKANCESLQNFVCDILADLGMQNSKLIVEVRQSTTLNKKGFDDVEFLFSANKGMPCEAISKVASGGEMSRLMLSLKALLSNYSNMPTLIFDEIDTGVSGKVADKMGEIIYRMSQQRQIINITHLPQIAAKGNTHFFVYKEHLSDESITNIKQLSDEERIKEIAQMISGEQLTDWAMAQAKELLGGL